MIKFLLTYTYTWWSSCRLEPAKEILVAFLCKVDFSVLYFHLFAKFEKLSEFVLHFVARTVVRWKHLKFLLVYIFSISEQICRFYFLIFSNTKNLGAFQALISSWWKSQQPHLYYHRIVNLHPFHHRADIRTFQNCLSFNKISLSFFRSPTRSAISNMVLTDTNVWLTDMAEILDLYQRGWLGGNEWAFSTTRH